MNPLESIKSLLEKEYYDVALEKFSYEENALEQLRVSLVFQDHPHIPDLMLFLMFIPNIEKELDGVSVLQYYIGFDQISERTEEQLVHLKDVIVKINQSLPLGHFGIIESEQILYLKYCQTYLGALNDTSSKQIVEAINALSFELSSNYDNFF
ncbi:MAG: hypothetical protein HOH81_02355 [Flavobacteriaceae bacterium]|jgi:hypothetical protein|nr:hypothetical protein [Flavobacteriaceae bacterium]MDA8993094.1 hypothetical protein [Flavobacteriaceae bacterium]